MNDGEITKGEREFSTVHFSDADGQRFRLIQSSRDNDHADSTGRPGSSYLQLQLDD